MNEIVKRMRKKISIVLNGVADRMAEQVADLLRHDPNAEHSLERLMQIQLSMEFRRLLLANSSNQLSFSDVEFSCYSQNGEDGILLYIFTMIGVTNKRVVEICAGDGIECNAANLIINHGWDGLLFDGNPDAIERGRAFYSQRTNAWRFRRLPPTLVHAWITRENVNSLIQNNGFHGEIDLLSIDLDGIDYWIWDALNVVTPRVVIIEYNNRWNASQSVTVPYSESFAAVNPEPDGEGYFGASLGALKELASKKGYRLVGANSPNTNAVFIRNNLASEFAEVPVETCLSSAYAIHQHQTKYPLIKDKPVVKV